METMLRVVINDEIKQLVLPSNLTDRIWNKKQSPFYEGGVEKLLTQLDSARQMAASASPGGAGTEGDEAATSVPEAVGADDGEVDEFWVR